MNRLVALLLPSGNAVWTVCNGCAGRNLGRGSPQGHRRGGQLSQEPTAATTAAGPTFSASRGAPPPSARWPCSMRASMPDDDCIMQQALHKLSAPPDMHRPTRAVCKRWSSARPTPSRYALQINRNVVWLQKNQITEGPRQGAWSYPGAATATTPTAHSPCWRSTRPSGRRGRPSASTSTTAPGAWPSILGRLPERRRLLGLLSRALHGTGSMTCAGITSLIIASDMVHPGRRQGRRRPHRSAAARATWKTSRIERAMRWLGQNFRVNIEPRPARQTIGSYYLYGVERAGRLTARPLHRRARLVSRRAPITWSSSRDSVCRRLLAAARATPKHDPVIGTSLALLFLSKGRRPVLLAKLKHGRGDDWNQHRNDVGNLTVYVETRWKRDLTWQVIDLQRGLGRRSAASAGALSLRQPQPVARRRRSSGKSWRRSCAITWTAAASSLPKAIAAARASTSGFRELMTLVFPTSPNIGLKLLDAGASDLARRGEGRRRSNCGRCGESSSAAARAWSTRRPTRRRSRGRRFPACGSLSRSGRQQKFTPAVQAQIDAARSIGINVLAYATNREVKWKEKFPRPLRRGTSGDQRRARTSCTSPSCAIPADATPRRGRW